MRLGFTGTRVGMTREQGLAFQLLISHRRFDPLVEYHHGDCTGADEESHGVIRRTRPRVTIIGHPPLNDKFRAFCDFDLEMSPLDYIERDFAIVDSVDYLVATPRQTFEVRRSGTWTTMRYAARQKKPVMVIWPDGTSGSYS